MKEVWKDIQGYEGLYQVSNLGRVKSLDRVASNGQFFKSRVLKHGRGRYLNVCLRLNGGKRSFLVHRLVAIAFIENEDNLPTVNHIDGDKLNNKSSNLEWMSYSENLKHSFKFLNRKASCTGAGRKGRLHPRSKKVLVFDLYGTLIMSFDSVSSVVDKGFCRNAVSRNARGLTKSYKNLIWKYV